MFFFQIEQKLGPVDYTSIIKDYLPLIRQGLYYSGYSSMRKLNINGSTVDIDIYFRADETPPALNIEAFIEGGLEPTFTMVNHYYVQAE